MEVYVGTSGWMYSWNRGRSLDWYVRNSGLNAVELNASFYRIPSKAAVKSWADKASSLRWAVKIHRYISHVKKLSEGFEEQWARFIETFKPLDPYIDFYLLQLPPSFRPSDENIERLKVFSRYVGLGGRLAVEFRGQGWFTDRTVDLIKEIGATLVSIDSPEGTWVRTSNGIVYLRLHGRGNWYFYNYSKVELEELTRAILGLRPIKVYVFFNNDHWMLENAVTMLSLLRST